MEATAKKALFNIQLVSSRIDFARLKRVLPAWFFRLRLSLLYEAVKGEDSEVEVLIRLADSIYACRQFGLLEHLGITLARLRASGAGEYYCALVAKNKGNNEESLVFLQKPADSDDIRLRAKALSTIGSILFERGEIEESLRHRLEALRLASRDYCEPLIVVEAQRAISIVKSIAGDHQAALTDLEKLLPLAAQLGKQHPTVYYDTLNSLAVELGEVGRIDEAAGALSLALASPFASAYPEWQATRAELIERRRGSSRRLVAVSGRSGCDNVLPFAVAPSDLIQAVGQKSFGFGLATVHQMNRWKMAETQKKQEPELSRKEKEKEVIHTILLCEDGELDMIHEFVKKLHSEAKDASES